MTTAQPITPRDIVEEEMIGWLATKSPQERRAFLSSAWVASLLSDEAIEELSHELQQEEPEEEFVAVGRD